MQPTQRYSATSGHSGKYGGNSNKPKHLSVYQTLSILLIVQQERSMEEMKTIPIYARDLKKVREFKERKGLNKLADAIRICIEFSDAHGALS